MTDQQIDEFLEMLAKSPTSARDMVRGLFSAHEAKAAPAVPQGFATLNEWFLSLPEQRQAQLRDDKWMLAGAAFEAGQALAPAVPQGITADENPLMALSDCINILESPKQLNDSVRVWACVQNAKAAMKLLAATPAAPSQETALHIGACITDGVLHATVMRREANGHVTILATAEMDAKSLLEHDCVAKLSPAAPSQPVNEAIEAIKFAIKEGIGASVFLNEWMHGDTDEWPEFGAIIAALREKEARK